MNAENKRKTDGTFFGRITSLLFGVGAAVSVAGMIVQNEKAIFLGALVVLGWGLGRILREAIQAGFELMGRSEPPDEPPAK